MISGFNGKQNLLAGVRSGTPPSPDPDQRIAWESENGEYVAGIVTFEPIGTSRARLNLELFYDSKGSRRAEEKFLSSTGERVEQDLERFRKFIEEQDSVNNGTGGIRDEVKKRQL